MLFLNVYTYKEGMARLMRGLTTRKLLQVTIALLMGASTLGTTGLALAATTPFALLVENGGQFTSYSRADGLVVWVSSDRSIFAVVNGQKSGEALGTAVIYAWQYSVPSAFAGSFGSLAGLGILRFGAPFDFTVHLGLIQTPTGDLLTTLAAGSPSPAGESGLADTTVRGSWILGNGTSVVGGKAEDLVIAGFWISNAPSPLGQLTVTIGQLGNLTVPPSDNTPFTRQIISPSCSASSCVDGGAFNSRTVPNDGSMPVRSFAAESIFGQGTGEHGHLLMIYAGGDDYAVVACSASQGSFWETTLPIAEPYEGCTLSGTGSFAAVSGSVDYCCGGGFPGPETLTITLNQVLP
jgi:hypothetical protein